MIIFILGYASLKYKYKSIERVYGITEMTHPYFVYVVPILLLLSTLSLIDV